MNELDTKEFAILNNETSLLGLIINDTVSYLNVSEIIRPEMFHFAPNGILYGAIQAVRNGSENFDISNLINYLTKEKLIEKIKLLGMEGYEYISKLMANAGFASELETYKKNLIDQYKTDRLNALLKAVEQTVENKKFDINNLINELQIQLINLDISEVNAMWETIGDSSKTILNNIINKEKTDTGIGLKFGFPQLDDLTLGVNPGDLVILAARPAMGKTAFALNIANNVAKKGKTVLFFSLEMSTPQLSQRMVAIDSIVPMSAIRKNEISQDQLKQLYWTVDRMKDWPMYLIDKASLTISDIITLSKRFHNNKRVDLIIVDYLQLIADSGKSNQENRQLEVAKISRSLKQLARELGCPVLSLSQLSRNVEKREDKIPIISDLRESGNIEQDADKIIFLHRKDYYNKVKPLGGTDDYDENKFFNDNSNTTKFNNSSLTDVIVAKNRQGGTGVVKLLFNPECNRFIYDAEAVRKQEKQKLYVPKKGEE
ncbi:replicative DNA helicase [Metamycoplasma neophronis]|uniref:Replicative DNA helicase n=1 Tax=Metamycoplasma neophronis TaxID=872983 RepID=A0ABY2Z0P5_9BACT|nr:replicative DNA helicase [Metamycoplasma neophronis]TPR54272.1 replicative DNA helicase [Metamycoplasma neophronis]